MRKLRIRSYQLLSIISVLDEIIVGISLVVVELDLVEKKLLFHSVWRSNRNNAYFNH
jgi:hypothetical protein